MIVLLYNPITNECIWEAINEYTVSLANKRFKITISRENKFGVATKAKLLILAYSKKIDDLAEEIDNLDVDKEALFALLNEQQKRYFSTHENYSSGRMLCRI